MLPELDNVEESLQDTLTKFVRKKKFRKKVTEIIKENGSQILTECNTNELMKLSKKYKNSELFTFLLNAKSKADIELPDFTDMITAACNDDLDIARSLFYKHIEEIIYQLHGIRKNKKPQYDYENLEIEWQEERWSTKLITQRVFTKLVEKGLKIERIGRILDEFHCDLDIIVSLENPELTTAYLESKQPVLRNNDLKKAFQTLIKNVDVQNLKILLDYNYNLSDQTIIVLNFFYLLMDNICELHRSEIGQTFIKTLINYEFFNGELLENLEWTLRCTSKENLEIFNLYEFRSVMKSRTDGRDMLACVFGNNNPGVLELLKSLKIDINSCGSYNRNPLHFAAKWHVKENIRELLARGANPNAFDELGLTPLNEALKYKICIVNNVTADDECVKLLLVNGASPLLIYREEETYYSLLLEDKLFFGISNYSLRENKFKNIAEYLVAQLAICDALGESVEKPIEDYMSLENERIDHSFYEKCRQQLTQLQALKIRDNIKFRGHSFTMFTVLVKNIEKIAQYLNGDDRRVIKEFMKKCKKEQSITPYYYDVLEYRNDVLDRLTKFIDSTKIVLCYCMGISDPNHLVIHKILGYLSLKDLLMSSP